MSKESLFELEVPIERQSLAEIVAKRILEMVSSQALKAGDRLPPERELTELLNVSRTSVREAIRGLSILGVVKVRQGEGTFISKLDGDALLGPIRFFLSLDDMNIHDLYNVRSLIEGEVARLAARNMDEKQLEQLAEELVTQKTTLSNAKAFRLSDYKFHEMIWIGSGNVFLKRIGESLNALGLEIRRRASENPQVLQQSYREHCELVAALQARDSGAATHAAEQHMQSVCRSTMTQDLGGQQK